LEVFVFPQQTTNSVNNGGSTKVPAPAERSIFRSEALQHYIQNQEKVVLPRLVSPRSFAYLWIFAGLSMIAGLMTAFWPWIEQFAMGIQ
jgi:hypothetical protein